MAVFHVLGTNIRNNHSRNLQNCWNEGMSEGRNTWRKEWRTKKGMQEGMHEERNEWVDVWKSEWMNEWLTGWMNHDWWWSWLWYSVFSKLCISHTTSLEELCLSSLAISLDTFVLSEHDKNILVSMWFTVAVYDKCQGLTLWLVQTFWKTTQNSQALGYHIISCKKLVTRAIHGFILEIIGVSLQRLQHPKFNRAHVTPMSFSCNKLLAWCMQRRFSWHDHETSPKMGPK